MLITHITDSSISVLPLWKWIIVGGVAGFAGAFMDSVLGASLQKMNRCSVCGQSVEVTIHCEKPTVPERGIGWINNDAVNLISSLGAGAVAWGLGMML
ncbi:hypothetical protein D3C78_1626830 [compost metagenome]